MTLRGRFGRRGEVPWQQLVDARLRMTGGDRLERRLHVGEGLDPVQLAGPDQRRQPGGVSGISCAGEHDGKEGDPPCPDANRL